MYRYATVVGLAGWVLWTSASGPCRAQDGPALPEGVTHVRLPPGAVRIERIIRNGKPLLSLSVGKTVIEGRVLFLGDGKGAMQVEATKEGTHWVSPKGGRGFVIDGVETHQPGSTLGVRGGSFLAVGQLKAGSVYLTTPSLKFEFQQERKGNAN